MVRIIAIVLATVALFGGSKLGAAPLHEAVKAGDTSKVQALIAEGADVDEVDFSAGAPLHIAAVRGHDQIVGELLEASANPDILEWGSDETPLHWAALGGHPEGARRLLEAGAQVDPLNNRGATPLMTALQNGHREVAELLMNEGADILIRSKTDELSTPMQLAGESGMFDLVEMMKARGASPQDPEPLEALLADANPRKGQAVYTEMCAQCHGTVSPPDRKWLEFGPPLFGVVGRDVASWKDFEYSEALSRVEGTWDPEKLNRIIANASGFFPGTKMVTHARMEIGVAAAQDRADLIAFLKAISGGWRLRSCRAGRRGTSSITRLKPLTDSLRLSSPPTAAEASGRAMAPRSSTPRECR